MAQLNNLIVTGSSRFLNKINGTCTDGSAGTTKYMRQDGTWQVPPNDNTDKKVTQTATTTNANYEVLFSGTADNTTRTEGARKSSGLVYNPSLMQLGVTGSDAGLYVLDNTSSTVYQTFIGSNGITIDGTCQIHYDSDDIRFTSTGDTWDGTHFSLKDALAAKSTVSFSRSLTSGTKIGTITINNTATDLYCQTNTNDAVKQTATNSTSASYELLFSATADNTTRTEGARKTCKLTFNPKNSEILLTNGDSTTVSTEGYTSICRHIGTDPSFFISRSPNGAKLDLVKNNSSGGVVKQLTATEEDITLVGTGNTWDGTNTSLKTALSKKLGNTGSQTITNGSVYISTSTITTGVGFFAKNRKNIQCYLYCGDDSMGLYSDNGHGGIIRKFLPSNEVAINGATYSVANPANFRSAIGAAASSSRLTKKNIEDITEAEAKKILEIDVKSFDYKDAYILEGYPKRDKYYGVIAEDVLKQIPFVVNVPDDYDESKIDETKGLHQSLLTVDYDKFVPYLIKMVQIQQKEINDLKQQLNKTTN